MEACSSKLLVVVLLMSFNVFLVSGLIFKTLLDALCVLVKSSADLQPTSICMYVYLYTHMCRYTDMCAQYACTMRTHTAPWTQQLYALVLSPPDHNQ